MNKKLVFLLVGFCKSGTSSLDAALRQDRRIMLSDFYDEKFYKGTRLIKVLAKAIQLIELRNTISQLNELASAQISEAV